MSEEPTTDEPLAFDRAEFAAPEDAAPACALCRRDLGDTYFTINGTIACDDCHHLVSVQVKESRSFGAFMRAAGYGAAAALGGSIAWYAVAKITGMEIGLLAIAVGWLVGKAVRHGARGPGARRYQALAMLLTYLSITGSYVPLVLKSFAEGAARHDSSSVAGATTTPAPSAAGADAKATESSDNHTPAPSSDRRPAAGALGGIFLFVAVMALALAAPFLSGAGNIIGILLIGIALYEAWKFNRPAPLVLEGPLHRTTPRRDLPPAP